MKNNFNQKNIKEKEFDSLSAEFLYNTLKLISKNKNNVSVALSGGSTPLPILALLRDYELNWKCYNFFMVDERGVSVSSPLSNYGNIKKVFLKGLNSSSYSMTNNDYSIEECVINYEKLLLSKVPLCENNLPVFDLILLGIGNDGHTASLFPNTKGLNENSKVVIKNKVPQLNTERITLTYPVILNALKIIIFAKGAAKSQVLKEIKTGKGNHYPVARIINSNVDITCILGIN